MRFYLWENRFCCLKILKVIVFSYFIWFCNLELFRGLKSKLDKDLVFNIYGFEG